MNELLDCKPIFENKCCGLCSDSVNNEPCGYRRTLVNDLPNCCGVCITSILDDGILRCTFNSTPGESEILDSEIGIFFICNSFSRMENKDIRQRFDPV